MTETPEWMADHRRAWEAKAGLRAYYRRELFARALSRLRPGPTLELGSGPGFFAEFHPGMVTGDIEPRPGLDVCFDAHAIPFADGCFANLVGIDVLHHLARPGQALGEIARVLRPGGRLVLIEPWTGSFGRFVYRYFHHEACAPVADPWTAAMAPDKAPGEGNAIIPKTLFVDRAAELDQRGGGLTVGEVIPFGALSYLLSGGFQRWGAPRAAISLLIGWESRIPRAWMASFALRALFLLHKPAEGGGDARFGSTSPSS